MEKNKMPIINWARLSNGYSLTLFGTLKMKSMATLKNIHPGEVLSEEFLVPFGISVYKLSKEVGIPQTRISEILKGNRRITA